MAWKGGAENEFKFQKTDPAEVGVAVLFAAMPGLSLDIKFRFIDMNTEQLLPTGILLIILTRGSKDTRSILKITGESATS